MIDVLIAAWIGFVMGFFVAAVMAIASEEIGE